MHRAGQERERVLRVRHLTTRLKTKKGVATVVDDVSFDLHPGRTLALVGESGCGKSMTALSLLRLLPRPPALNPEGEVLYRGKNLLTLPEAQLRQLRGSRLAMIFQDPNSALNPVYTIGDQLIEALNLHLGIFGKEAEERASLALEEVGIPEPAKRLKDFPHQLSGGMKQRVMIAMAMLAKPDILIADEPTTALDVTIQAQVLELMRQLMERHGTALLLITHDMGVVAEMADEVVVMYAAKAVEHGSVEALFHCPSHPYTKGLFASRPSCNKPLTPIPGYVPSAYDFPKGCRFHPRCAHATEKCQIEEPPQIECGPGHATSCWLAS